MVGKYILRFTLVAVSLCYGVVARAIPEIQSWESDNGARVLFVENRNLPMVDIRIVFDAGSARDGELPGLAALTNGLLAEGAGGKSAQELAEGFESVGAQIDYDSLRDMAFVGVRSLTEEVYLEDAIQYLATVVSQPDFPEKAFQRELARMKVAEQAKRQSPSDIAEEAFYRALYQEHPYASPPGGTTESLAKITLQDIKNFYQQYYVAKNAVIAIVGDVDRQHAEKLVQRFTNKLSAGGRAKELPKVPELNQPENIVIDFPSKQSHIFIGQPGTKRGDEDYFTLYVANHPFGGSGFASRLVKVIREDRGLAYSVYSYFSPMRDKGPFMMGMQTKNEQAKDAIRLLKDELKTYVQSGPEDDELMQSKENIVGGFPLNLDSNSKLLGYIAMIGFYDLPRTYLNDFVANIKKVTRKDIRRALAERIKLDNLVTVIVGQGH